MIVLCRSVTGLSTVSRSVSPPTYRHQLAEPPCIWLVFTCKPEPMMDKIKKKTQLLSLSTGSLEPRLSRSDLEHSQNQSHSVMEGSCVPCRHRYYQEGDICP